MYELTDVFELSGRGEKPCRCTGAEICQAARLRQSKAMLAAQLMSFGFAGIAARKISADSGAGEHISQQPHGAGAEATLPEEPATSPLEAAASKRWRAS